jgi:hypothetical protein
MSHIQTVRSVPESAPGKKKRIAIMKKDGRGGKDLLAMHRVVELRAINE